MLLLALLIASSDLRLDWTAPPPCPSVEAVRAEIEHLSGRTITLGADAPLSAVVKIARESDERFVGHLVLRTGDAGDRRTLQARRCDELARSVALMLSLAIDTEPPEVRPEPEIPSTKKERPPRNKPAQEIPSASPPLNEIPSTSTTANEVPSVPSLSEEAATATITANEIHTATVAANEIRTATAAVNELRPATRRPPLEVAVHFHGVAGALPTTGFAFEAGARYCPFEQLSFGAGFTIWIPERTIVRRAPEAGASLSLVAPRADVCLRVFASSPLAADLCAGAELLFFRGVGFGVSDPKTEGDRWLAPFVGAGISHAIFERFALTLRAEAAVPAVRPILVLDGVGEIHRMSAVLFRAGIGGEVRFE